MKIKNNNRSWDLKVERVNDCIEIIENHQDSDDGHNPYIAIPVEAVDEVVFRLLEFKRRIIIKRGEP
jgi:hypothetical protein